MASQEENNDQNENFSHDGSALRPLVEVKRENNQEINVEDDNIRHEVKVEGISLVEYEEQRVALLKKYKKKNVKEINLMKDSFSRYYTQHRRRDYYTVIPKAYLASSQLEEGVPGPSGLQPTPTDKKSSQLEEGVPGPSGLQPTPTDKKSSQLEEGVPGPSGLQPTPTDKKVPKNKGCEGVRAKVYLDTLDNDVPFKCHQYAVSRTCICCNNVPNIKHAQRILGPTEFMRLISKHYVIVNEWYGEVFEKKNEPIIRNLQELCRMPRRIKELKDIGSLLKYVAQNGNYIIQDYRRWNPIRGRKVLKEETLKAKILMELMLKRVEKLEEAEKKGSKFSKDKVIRPQAYINILAGGEADEYSYITQVECSRQYFDKIKATGIDRLNEMRDKVFRHDGIPLREYHAIFAKVFPEYCARPYINTDTPVAPDTYKRVTSKIFETWLKLIAEERKAEESCMEENNEARFLNSNVCMESFMQALKMLHDAFNMPNYSQRTLVPRDVVILTHRMIFTYLMSVYRVKTPFTLMPEDETEIRLQSQERILEMSLLRDITAQRPPSRAQVNQNYRVIFPEEKGLPKAKRPRTSVELNEYRQKMTARKSILQNYSTGVTSGGKGVPEEGSKHYVAIKENPPKMTARKTILPKHFRRVTSAGNVAPEGEAKLLIIQKVNGPKKTARKSILRKSFLGPERNGLPVEEKTNDCKEKNLSTEEKIEKKRKMYEAATSGYFDRHIAEAASTSSHRVALKENPPKMTARKAILPKDIRRVTSAGNVAPEGEAKLLMIQKVNGPKRTARKSILGKSLPGVIPERDGLPVEEKTNCCVVGSKNNTPRAVRKTSPQHSPGVTAEGSVVPTWEKRGHSKNENVSSEEKVEKRQKLYDVDKSIFFDSETTQAASTSLYKSGTEHYLLPADTIGAENFPLFQYHDDTGKISWVRQAPMNFFEENYPTSRKQLSKEKNLSIEEKIEKKRKMYEAATSGYFDRHIAEAASTSSHRDDYLVPADTKGAEEFPLIQYQDGTGKIDLARQVPRKHFQENNPSSSKQLSDSAREMDDLENSAREMDALQFVIYSYNKNIEKYKRYQESNSTSEFRSGGIPQIRTPNPLIAAGLHHPVSEGVSGAAFRDINFIAEQIALAEALLATASQPPPEGDVSEGVSGAALPGSNFIAEQIALAESLLASSQAPPSSESDEQRVRIDSVFDDKEDPMDQA